MDMCEYNGGSESAQHTAPDRQAAFQNIQRANGLNRTFIRLMIDHMEEPRANQAGNDNSQNAVRNFLGIEAFSSRLFKRQPDARNHGGRYDQAVLAQMEMAC